MINSWLGKAAVLVLGGIFIVNLSRGQTGGYSVTERGPNYKVLQKTTVEHGANRVSRYVELATGMNYTNAAGQWVEAREQVVPQPTGGAAAIQGRHQAYFPSDISHGVLEVVTPDGRHLKSRPLGVSYDDGSNTVFIATLKPAQGYLTSSNAVTYRDAFDGFKADLVCTYRRSGFECDLVIRQRPPAPGNYGLNESSSTIQMVTEFFDTADPEQIPAAEDEWYGLQDNTLKFGQLTMKQGVAFGINPTNSARLQRKTPFAATPVYKHWLKTEGRKFLIEELPLENVAEELEALPLSAGRRSNHRRGQALQASGHRQFPPAPDCRAGTNQMLLAAAGFTREPAVVLDYMMVTTEQTDYTFYAGNTYAIDPGTAFAGATTIEGGAVLKGCIQITGTVNCDTTPLNPAFITCWDDDSAGDPVDGSTGEPVAENCLLDVESTSPAVLKNLHFSYGGIWVSWSEMFPNQVSLENVQIMHGGYGIAMYGGALTARNVLIHDVDVGFFLEGAPADVEHLTVDQCGWLWADENDARPFGVTNSILVGTFDLSYVPLQPAAVVVLQDPAGVFSSAGGNDYYLATDSPCRDAGTTAINPDLWTELQTMTTYAPQDGWYLDTDPPDLGYHYPVSHGPPWANCQDVMTGLGTSISIPLSGSDPNGERLVFSIVPGSGPQFGTLGQITQVDASNAVVTYTPDAGFQGEDGFDIIASNGGYSSQSSHVTVMVVPKLTVTTESLPHSIILRWSWPLYLPYDYTKDFEVYRCSASGDCTPITAYATVDNQVRDKWEFVDTNVEPGMDYCYRVTLRHQDTGDETVIYETPFSDTRCATVGCPDASAPFWTDYGPTPQQLAQAIMGPGFAVNNVAYTGHPMARGTFGNGANANLPIDRGVILCTGYLTDAERPDGYDTKIGFDNMLPGDAGLDKIIADTSEVTTNAAILEFDVTTSSSTIAFDYFFASQEYPNWQSQYDDVTAIFVDGTNIALIPGNLQPISIYTVNSSINTQYYRFNPPYSGNNDPPLFDVSYTGLTTLFAAHIAASPNVPHHVKIAIADARDGTRDSAIFINASIPCP